YNGEISDHNLSSGCPINSGVNTFVAVNMCVPQSHSSKTASRIINGWQCILRPIIILVKNYDIFAKNSLL
ncbi:hypothetical protein OFO29_45085, partial [Escherichia coli]|nr:hypothetical protein [Escherichia coli]